MEKVESNLPLPRDNASFFKQRLNRSVDEPVIANTAVDLSKPGNRVLAAFSKL